MNYIIGMCKKNKEWVTILADLGYDAEIIEQRITTSSGDSVKPDLVAASNRLVHSLVFDVKGGISINPDQLKRYSTLTPENLVRWITIFDRVNLQFDVCICDVGENHGLIKIANKDFPMLTFNSEAIVKEREFKRDKLNEAFREPISLNGKIPPLSYYPFSEEDEDPYIALYVIRGLLSIALRNSKGGPSVFEESVISSSEIVSHQFHHVWKALSVEHRNKLNKTIREVIGRFLAKKDVKETLGLIEQKKGYKIQRNLEQFKKGAEAFIAELQTQITLNDFG